MTKGTIMITIDLVNKPYNVRPMTSELALAALILMRTGSSIRHVAELPLVNKGSMKSAVESRTPAHFRQTATAEEANNDEDRGEGSQIDKRVGDVESDANSRGDDVVDEGGRRDDPSDADDEGSIRVEDDSGGAVSVDGAGNSPLSSPVRDGGEENGRNDGEQEQIDDDLSFGGGSSFRSYPASEEKKGSDSEQETIYSDVTMNIYSTPASDTSEEIAERSEFQVSVGLCRLCSFLAGDVNSEERDIDSYVEILDFPDGALPCPDYSTAKGYEKGAACLFAHKKSSLRSLLEYLGSAQSSIDICMHLITSEVIMEFLLQLEKQRSNLAIRLITNKAEAFDRNSKVSRLTDAGVAVHCHSTRYFHHKESRSICQAATTLGISSAGSRDNFLAGVAEKASTAIKRCTTTADDVTSAKEKMPSDNTIDPTKRAAASYSSTAGDDACPGYTAAVEATTKQYATVSREVDRACAIAD